MHVRHGGVHAGGVAVAWMLGTSALLGVPVDGPLLVAAFCGTSLVYLVDRASGASPEDGVNRPERTVWQEAFRGWIVAEAGLWCLGLAVVAPLLHTETLLLAGAIGGVSAVHVWPLIPHRGRLKRIGAAKPFVVAGTWAMGGVALPLVETGSAFTTTAVALLALRGAFVLANVLLSDWSDRVGDAGAGVATLATPWTSRRLRRVTSGLAAAAVVGTLGAGDLAGGDAQAAAWAVDAVGPALLGLAVWRLDPTARAWHALAADLLVAWPAVTFAAAFVAT